MSKKTTSFSIRLKPYVDGRFFIADYNVWVCLGVVRIKVIKRLKERFSGCAEIPYEELFAHRTSYQKTAVAVINTG